SKRISMKMTKGLLAVAMLLTMNVAHAASDDYQMFCGSAKSIEDVMHAQGHSGKLTKKDIAELQQSRQPMLDVLANGPQGIAKIIADGDKSDIGGFGVIMVCGVLTSIKAEVQANGCVDMVHNKVVMDTAG